MSNFAPLFASSRITLLVTEMPLYMEAVMTILRSMEDTFDYTLFREELKAQSFSGTQKSMLNLRLSLLDSCLKGGSTKNRVSTHFGKGHLTIIEYVLSPSNRCITNKRLQQPVITIYGRVVCVWLFRPNSGSLRRSRRKGVGQACRYVRFQHVLSNV